MPGAEVASGLPAWGIPTQLVHARTTGVPHRFDPPDLTLATRRSLQGDSPPPRHRLDPLRDHALNGVSPTPPAKLHRHLDLDTADLDPNLDPNLDPDRDPDRDRLSTAATSHRHLPDPSLDHRPEPRSPGRGRGGPVIGAVSKTQPRIRASDFSNTFSNICSNTGNGRPDP
jgi:hypothetical protein